MKPEQSTSALIAIFKDALNHSNETPALKYKRGIPDAAIDASLKNRSKRRWTELKDGEKNITITTVESDLENRDIIDSNRVHSPLVIPENAIVINSDDLSINQVLKKILHFIK